MKKEILAGAIFLVVILCVFLNIFFINKMMDELFELIDSSEASAMSEDWISAESSAEKAAEIWKKNEKYTHIVLRHSEVNETSEAFFNFLESIYTKDPGSVKGNTRLLKSRLQEIIDIESITVGSVF